MVPLSGDGAAQLVTSGPLLVALLVAAAAGAVSFFSPCCLPLVPGYLSYVAGVSGGDAQQVRRSPRATGASPDVSAGGVAVAPPVLAGTRVPRSRAVTGTALFVAGFAAVFTSYGLLFGAVGAWLITYQQMLVTALGAVTIVLGLMFTGVLSRVPLAGRTVRLGYQPRVGLAGAPVLGVVFGLGWGGAMSRRPEARPLRVRRLQVGAAAVAAALVLAGCTTQTAGDEQTRSGSQQGYLGGQSFIQVPPAQRKSAPVATGPALAEGGAEVSTGGYPGKIVVVNVWGSWCAPCRKEAPDLVAVSMDTADVAQFVGLDVRDYNPAPARAFVRAFAVPYPQIYDPQGAQLIKFTDLPASGIPSTLFIDRRGRIAARVIGATSQTTLTQIIRDLAAEP